jgi:alpha-beta hydrolase superfamily lysophospholipase
VYEGWYHELHNEVEKETVLADIVAWIDQTLG